MNCLLRNNLNEKILLLRLLIENLLKKNPYIHQKLRERFSEYLDNPYLRNYVINNNYIDLFIELFKKSSSYEIAGINSVILLQLKDGLDQKQLEILTIAFMENDQNFNSYEAQRNICQILNSNLSAVPYKYRNKLEEISRNLK